MSAAIASEESRRAFVERKNQVLELMEAARGYYENDGRPEMAQVFADLHKNLMEGEFSIVVVGEFSAGKSTLLNALMGKRLLPSYSNETTATVNFLRHTEKAAEGEAGRIFYNDGTEVTIDDASLETVEKYVSTKGENVAQNVKHLDLYLDSDFLKDGVTLVDSPGLNGIKIGHKEITEEQILKSHASIFVFNSDHPGSKTDFDFLYDLQKKVKTILFVLNKIDEIKEGEGETPETVIQSLKQSYKSKFPEVATIPEIWPVAAFPALVARNSEPLEYHEKKVSTAEDRKKLEKKSKIQAFEDRLMSFLTCGEKTRQQLLAPVERVLALAQETREEYNNDILALEGAVDGTEIETQITGIRESIDGLQEQIAMSRQEVTRVIGESLRDLREELEAEMSRLQTRKLSEIEEFDNLDELVSYLQSFEESFLAKVYNIAADQEYNLRERIFDVIKMQYAAQTGKIREEFSKSENRIKRSDISVSEHLDKGERLFKVGLNEMNEKIAQMEDELKKLQREADEAGEQWSRARASKRKREELKNEIKDYRDRKDTIESQMLPPVERYTKEVQSKEPRGGLLGVVGMLLFGFKRVTKHEIETDSSEYDNARKKQETASRELEEKIEAMTIEMSKIKEEDPDYAELMQIRKQGEVDAMREKIDATMKEKMKEMEQKYNKKIKSIKKELTDYCDSVTDELKRQVRRMLRDSEQDYTEVVLAAVEGTLKERLAEKKTHLEQLEKQIKSSEENKKERITALREKVVKINELMGHASDLKTNLEAVPVDEIKEEAIG